MDAVLQDMYATRRLTDASGKVHEVRAHVSPPHAEALHQLVLERKPELVLEVGMACGASSLAILSGLESNGKGKLISIDPFEHEWFDGAGLHAVEKAGLAGRHELMEEPSHTALPRLLASGVRIDLAYQDAIHEFGAELVDLHFLIQLLNEGGFVGLNDCNLAAVHRLCRYLNTRPDLSERPIVPRSYQGRNILMTFGRWLARRPVSDRWFEKVATWTPPFNFYRRF